MDRLPHRSDRRRHEPESTDPLHGASPQFIDPAAGGTAQQILLLGLAPILIGLVTDTSWALAAGRARTWFGSSPRRMATIGRVGGLALIGVGASVAVSGSRQ